ncbi:helix-turn-helix domain-containing protein [Aeromonas sp. MdU4]|uniref:helix-turn-helix domain-containing protein n=1 Tax=Aeromonas sp. MdU4 TaxID=3342819 RepID=UPI0035B7399D
MLAIPVPFFVSFLLGLLALALHVRLAEQARMASLFLALCAATTGLVGLRWTFDIALFALLQPIFAALIPVAAWYAFTRTSGGPVKPFYLHAIAPAIVMIGVITHPILMLPLDMILTATYLFYGIALVRYAAQAPLLLYVSFNNWEGVKRAENIAGWMLLFSALIDGAISVDFSLNQGRYSPYILTLGHLILLPVLALAVVTVGVNTAGLDNPPTEASPDCPDEANSEPLMSDVRAHEIVTRLDRLMQEKSCYLDPELTLAALSRKLCIPAKQISIAVNRVHHQNISRVINDYRIEYAKRALLSSDESITQIMMNSGFQTKSNFNREFSRITGMTPTLFRKQQGCAITPA